MIYRIILFIFFIASIAVAKDITQPIADGSLLKNAGLGQLWQTKLAVKKNERLVELTLLGDKVCALTSTNYFFCLNRNDGDVLFGIQLAPEGFPVLRPKRYENQILIVAGNNLLQLDGSSGAKTYTKKFDYTVLCPVVRNSSYLYAAGSGSGIEAIEMASGNSLYKVAASSGSRPTDIIVNGDYMIFSTKGGNVACVSAVRLERFWQFDAMDAINVGMARDNNDLYVASRDTNIYKLIISSGRMIWKYQLGGSPDTPPQITADAIYQSVAEKGVAAIDKQSGLALWMVDGGVGLLAQINGKAYVMTDNHTAATTDIKGRKLLGEINFAQAELFASNTIDEKIYIANADGRVACIEAAK